MSNSSTSSLPEAVKVVNKAVKSSKKLVEKVIESITCSDSDSSIMTPIFTHNSPVSEMEGGSFVSSLYKKTLVILNHKKIKWVIIIVILIVILFFYFKSQNKTSKKSTGKTDKVDKEEFEITKDNNDKPVLVKKQMNDSFTNNQMMQMPHQMMPPQTYQQMMPPQTYQQMMPPQTYQQTYQPQTYQQMSQPQTSQQMIQPQMIQPQTSQPQTYQQMGSINKTEHKQRISNTQSNKVLQDNIYESLPDNRNKQKNLVQSNIITVEPDSSDEELSQEDINVMNHNLTVEEIESINRQLDQDGTK